MNIKTIKTRIFKPDENILNFMEKYLSRIAEKSIIVITSKIVALSEGRFVKKIDEKTKTKIIASESDFVLPTKYVCLTIKDGVVMANAGVDESNANGRLILLPNDSFETAIKIRNHFKKKHGLKTLGVIITDSRCLPLRAGITGVALGYAGFEGLKDYRKKVDIFGRPFHYSRVDVADSLATAAVLCMGEGNERQPLAIIENAPIEYSNMLNRDELKIDIKEDMYKPMFEQIM
jgi:dihydrofolate synthase / folylpolyglutamate synthase